MLASFPSCDGQKNVISRTFLPTCTHNHTTTAFINLAVILDKCRCWRSLWVSWSDPWCISTVADTVHFEMSRPNVLSPRMTRRQRAGTRHISLAITQVAGRAAPNYLHSSTYHTLSPTIVHKTTCTFLPPWVPTSMPRYLWEHTIHSSNSGKYVVAPIMTEATDTWNTSLSFVSCPTASTA